MRHLIGSLAGLMVALAGLLPVAQAADSDIAYIVSYFEVSPAAKNAVFAVTHVDIVPKLKDEGVALTKELAVTGRKYTANTRFETLTQNSRTNHMTVVEIWADRRAMEAHSTASHMKQYREKLLPMSGSLYDERLYRALD